MGIALSQKGDPLEGFRIKKIANGAVGTNNENYLLVDFE